MIQYDHGMHNEQSMPGTATLITIYRCACQPSDQTAAFVKRRRTAGTLDSGHLRVTLNRSLVCQLGPGAVSTKLQQLHGGLSPGGHDPKAVSINERHHTIALLAQEKDGHVAALIRFVSVFAD